MISYVEEYLTNCVMYILTMKQKGWSSRDESFYREYDFICHERFQKDLIPISSQNCNLQTEVSIS